MCYVKNTAYYIASYVLTFAVSCILPKLLFGQYDVEDVDIKHGDEVPKYFCIILFLIQKKTKKTLPEIKLC